MNVIIQKKMRGKCPGCGKEDIWMHRAKIPIGNSRAEAKLFKCHSCGTELKAGKRG